MTAEEKAGLARFLDLASVCARGGYADTRGEYDFDDDPEPEGDVSAGAKPEPENAPGVYAAPSAGLFADDREGAGFPENDDLELIESDARSCGACRLAQTRKNAVPGEGSRRPLVMVIGEGPGADEDETGRPFVGKAGQLLDKMLAAIDLSREKNCFIANVIKCRPPNNRDPNPDETAACAPFLARQVRLLKPAFVLCAGRIAAQTLLDTTDGIGKLRGKVSRLNIAGMSVPFLATYHPSALLRNEDLKRPAWEDLKLLRTALTEMGLDPAD